MKKKTNPLKGVFKCEWTVFTVISIRHYYSYRLIID